MIIDSMKNYKFVQPPSGYLTNRMASGSMENPEHLKMKKSPRIRFFWCIIVFGLLVFVVRSLDALQTPRQAESDVEKLLSQGDSYSKKGDHKLALGCYLEASALSQSRMNLSRAYFGLSLSHFNLRDTATSTKYMRKVLEVDPNKEISELFYPKSFIQLFRQVQKDVEAKEKIKAEEVVVKKPAQERANEEQKKVEEEKKKEEGIKKGEVTQAGQKEDTAKKEEETKKTDEKPKAEEKKDVPPPPQTKIRPPVSAPPLTDELEVLEEEKGGHWEVSAHYSTWSVNFIKTMFEDSLKDELGEDIQNEIVKKSGTIQTGLVKLNYTQNLSFDSGGSNHGVEVRYFSKGRAGTFSLGLAFEKTYVKLSLLGTARQEFTNGGSSAVDVTADLETSPFSTNINFRWEIGANARIAPYFVMGLGFAPLKGTFTYTYTGTFQAGGVQETISDSKEKDFDELSRDIDFKIPDLFVILQLHFGVKAQLYKGLYLLGEAGIWDGLMLRGGLAYRF